MPETRPRGGAVVSENISRLCRRIASPDWPRVAVVASDWPTVAVVAADWLSHDAQVIVSKASIIVKIYIIHLRYYFSSVGHLEVFEQLRWLELRTNRGELKGL